MNDENVPFLYLSADDVRRALPMAEAISTMRDAFGQLSSGRATMPPRQRIDSPDGRGVALVMACRSDDLGLFSVKMITVFPENPRRGLPSNQAVVMLSDAATGRHLAMLEGSSLTAIRTGAASGLATELLAPSGVETAAIFGAGVQARTQLEAVCCVRPIQRARVFDPDRALAERFADEVGRQLGIAVERAETPARAVAGAGVICTATPSSKPVFSDSDLADAVHINAVGGFKPDYTELPAETVCRARVVVDHRASILEEAGDLLQPLRRGLIQESHFQFELGDVVLGRTPGRCPADKATLFKSVGVAVQDLCAAARAVENARLLGLGTRL